MEFISMTCRNCGGKLSISKDADQCICVHCGSEYLVTFGNNTISLKMLSETLSNIKISSDRTASELALERIRQEKQKLHNESGIQAVMLNLFHRNTDKYHLKLDPDLIQKIGPYEFNTSVAPSDLYELRSYCEKALLAEKARLFPDKLYIDQFERSIEKVEKLIPVLSELLEQEEFHRKVVTS